MSYRTLLVQVAQDAQNNRRLEIARALARRFDAALIGAYAAPPPLSEGDLYGALFEQVGPDMIVASRRAAADVCARAGASFKRVCGSDGNTTWTECEGDRARVLTDIAHCADLVIVSQTRPEDVEARSVLEHLIIGAGPPVLMLPADSLDDFGKVIMVGWNGSRESSKAVHDGMPFLRAAERVVLCTVGERAGRSLVPASAMLRRHDIPIHLSEITAYGDDVGEVLQEQAKSEGANLLVVGAYGHSRLRELVFGGATSQLLNHARVPVLFSN